MGTKWDDQRVKKIAAIIAAHENNVKDVNLASRAPGSLVDKIAKELKVASNAQLRSKLRYLWDSSGSLLKATVVSLIVAKREVDGNVQSKYGSEMHANSASVIPTINPKVRKAVESTNINSYRIIDVAGDGNCLFRCFAYHVFGDENAHLRVREEMVKFTVVNWATEVNALLSTCVETVYTNSDHYQKIMSRSGVYGTDYEIRVFTKVYRASVIVFTKQKDSDVIGKGYPISCLEGSERPDLNLLFIGHERRGHWVILMMNSEATSAVCNTQHKSGSTDCRNRESLTACTDMHVLTACSDSVGKTRANVSTDHSKSFPSKVADEGIENACLKVITSIETADISAIIRSDGKSQIPVNGAQKKENRESVERTTVNETNGVVKNMKQLKKHTTTLEESVGISTIEKKPANKTIFNNRTRKRADCKKYEKVQENTADVYKFTSDSSNEYTSEESGDERQYGQTRMSKRTVFTVDLGTIEIPSSHFKTTYGEIDEDKIRTAIEQVMLCTLQCTCYLTFYGSVRRNQRDVVTYAKCKKADHKQRYQFRIDNMNEPVARLHVSSNDKLKHVHSDSLIADTFRVLKGPERRKWQKEMKYRSVTDFLGEIQAKTSTDLKGDGHMQDLRQLNVLYKAKSEEKCKGRSVLKSYDVLDLMGLWFEEHILNDPFLRFVSLPLTVRMHKAEDLLAMSGQKPVILHLDATGSVVRTPQDLRCKRIFYYCLLAKHNTEILKLAQMITSQHNVQSISAFLKEYKELIEYHRMWPLADAVVIDWSWAFIHSILFEWNTMKIREYLRTMYEYCVNNVPPRKGMVVVKICFAHFMKSVSRTIMNSFPEYKEFKVIILECMALMCISRTIKQLDELFKHVCTLLMCQNRKKAMDSLAVINNLTKRNTEKLKDVEREGDLERPTEDVIFNNEERSSSIYRSSPFYKRYNTMMILLQNHLDRRYDDDKNEKRNKYYAPKFVDHMITTWMPYAVLWTALDLDLVDTKISRVSNAYIESENKVLKEKVFDKVTNSSIADRVRQLREAQKTTMAKIILNANLKGTKKSRRRPKYPAVACDLFAEENWQKKKTSRKRKFAHVAATYLKNVYRTTKGNQAELHHNRRSRLKEKDNNTTNQEIFHVDCENDGLINVKQMEAEEVEPESVKKLYNGLIDDPSYYMTSSSSSVTVSIYSTEKSLSTEIFQLTANEFASLRSGRWINGLVIDSFAASCIDEWNNITLVPTDETSIILGDFSGKRVDKKRKICRSNKTVLNKLFMPYLYQGHWRLLIANIKEEKLISVDPYETDSDRERVIEAFKNFLQVCESSSSFGRLQDVNWTEQKLTNRPYQPFNDGHSCGVYIMYYMECIGAEKSFSDSFDPSEYRQKSAHNLLLKSNNMADICVQCFGCTSTDSSKCVICERKCHDECFYKTHLTTDDEDIGIKKKSRKKEGIRAPIPKVFTCRLCKRYNMKEAEN